MSSGQLQLQQLSDELHAALAPLLLNKTETPLLFLCSHFRDRAGYNYNPVSAAYRTLRLCSSEGQHCETNIMQAYRTLAGDQGHVTSQQFLDLVAMLTDALPTTLADALTEVFKALSALPPDFSTFHDAIKVCILLQELTVKAQQGTSGHMFQLPEAKKLLTRLLQQRQWLSGLEPQEQIQRLRAVHLPQQTGSSEALLDVRLQEDAVAQRAGQLAALALAAES